MRIPGVWMVVLWLVAGGVALGAEPPAGPPPEAVPEAVPRFADPEWMFRQLFGEQAQEDRQALAEIEISAREERELGRQAVEASLAYLKRQGITVVSRGKDVAYLHALVETVRPMMVNAARYPAIRIYLARSPECEARSFPGGTLIFFQGLLETAQSEAALIAVVGHELSHLDRGHQLQRLRRMKLAQRTFSGKAGGATPEEFFRAGTAVVQIWTRPFRPEAEAEADRDGATWAYRAGYDPRELAALLLRMRRRDAAAGAPMPWFLKSHPDPLSRHREVTAVYERLQQENPRESLYVGRENLRRRIPRSKREFADR